MGHASSLAHATTARPWAATCARLAGIIVVLLLAAARIEGGAASPSEAEVKAAYVFNFVKFVEWPSAAFRQPGDRIVIAVLGDSPVYQALAALDGHDAQGRTVTIRQVARLDDARGAHVLFVSRSAADMGTIVKWADGMPILTVTDLDEARPGSIINLVRIGTRIGFDVDLDAAGDAGLRVSSRLLSVARAIQRRAGTGGN